MTKPFMAAIKGLSNSMPRMGVAGKSQGFSRHCFTKGSQVLTSAPALKAFCPAPVMTPTHKSGSSENSTKAWCSFLNNSGLMAL